MKSCVGSDLRPCSQTWYVMKTFIIHFVQKADSVLFLGVGGMFFFPKYKESFVHVVTADVSRQEHLFHYVTDLLLLLTNSKKTMYGQVLRENAGQLMSCGELANARVFR